MKTVLIDVDGPVADFCGFYLDIVQTVLGKTFGVDDIDQWDCGKALGLRPDELDAVHRVLFADGSCSRVRPCKGAINGVLALAEISDVWFVTSPMLQNRTWAHDRANWIVRHFGSAYKSKVVSANRKELVFGDVFVDDKEENLTSWQNRWPASSTVLWDIPPNRYSTFTPTLRTNSWDEVLRLVKDGHERSEAQGRIA